MTEQGMDNKYIKCSRCVRKFINDNDHIKHDFGYNRLEERFKTCVQCRDKNRNNQDMHKDTRHFKYEENRDAILAQNKIYRENNKEQIQESGRLYKLNHADKIKESKKKTYEKHKEAILENMKKYKVPIKCELCGAMISSKYVLAKHQETKICMKNIECL